MPSGRLLFSRTSQPERHPISIDPAPKQPFEDPAAHDRLSHDIHHGFRLHAAVPDTRSRQFVRLPFAVVALVGSRRDVAEGDVENDVSGEGVAADVADESEMRIPARGMRGRDGQGEVGLEVVAEDGAVDAAATVAAAVSADENDWRGHGLGCEVSGGFGGWRGRCGRGWSKEFLSECTMTVLGVCDARNVLKAGEQIG